MVVVGQPRSMPVTDERPRSMWRYSTPTFQLPANIFEMPAPALQPALTSDLLPENATLVQPAPPGVQAKPMLLSGIAIGQTTRAVGQPVAHRHAGLGADRSEPCDFCR